MKLWVVCVFPLALQTDEPWLPPSPFSQNFLVLNIVLFWYATPCSLASNIPEYENSMLCP